MNIQRFIVTGAIFVSIVSSLVVIYVSFFPKNETSVTIEAVAYEKQRFKFYFRGRTKLEFHQLDGDYYVPGNRIKSINVEESALFGKCIIVNRLRTLKSYSLNYRPIGYLYLILFFSSISLLIYAKNSVSATILAAIVHILIINWNISVFSFLLLKV